LLTGKQISPGGETGVAAATPVVKKAGKAALAGHTPMMQHDRRARGGM
jgi:hypothetical protein